MSESQTRAARRPQAESEQDDLPEPTENAGERVLVTVTYCLAEGCQNPRRSRHGEYCSDACRARAYKARPPTQKERILARLRQGPATSLELVKAGAGLRYGARIAELRGEGKRIRGPVVAAVRVGLMWSSYLEPIPKSPEGYPIYKLEE